MATLVTMAHKKLEQADVITWASIHNIVSIVISVLAVAVAFFALQTRVEVLRDNVDRLEEHVKELKGTVRGIATDSAELVPIATETPTPTIKPTRAITPGLGEFVGPDTP